MLGSSRALQSTSFKLSGETGPFGTGSEFVRVRRTPTKFLRELNEVQAISVGEGRLANSVLFRMVTVAKADHPAV